jgi:protein tyrosine phosphatase
MNANYINGLVKDHYAKSLIASSAPVPKTLLKFWKMIWQNKVPLIVMLCKSEDGDQAD